VSFLPFLLVLVAIACVLGVPVYVLGRRRGVEHAWLAFIPILGVAAVLFESIGRSGWYAFLAFIPTIGPLVIYVWTAVEVPEKHGRSRWWTAALIVPGPNVIGYWIYAFTLPRHEPDLAFA
jgi:hypothetical protein